MDAVAQVRDRLDVGGALRGAAPGPHPVGDGLLGLPSFRVVVGEKLGLLLRDLRRDLLQDGGALGVELLAPGAQQGAVGGFLDQRVLEHVGGVVRRAALVDQLGAEQVAQCGVQRVALDRGQGREMRESELAPDHGAHLGQLLGGRMPVEPGQQRVVQRVRDGQRWQRAEQLIVLAHVAQDAELENRLGELLDEQGDAVGAREDLVQQLGREPLAPGDLRDHGHRLAARQPAQRECRDMRQARPVRLELGPVGYEQEHGGILDVHDALRQQLLRGRVDPVRVLEQHENGLAPGERQELRDEHLQRPALALLGREVGRRIARRRGDREQVGEQRHGVRGRPRLGQGLQLLQPHLGGIVRPDAGGVEQLGDHGVERAVAVIGRALVADRQVLAVVHIVAQHLRDPRLAHARVGGQQHDLALAGPRGVPALPEQGDLRLAADDREQHAPVHGLEPRTRVALPEHAPHAGGPGDAFEVVQAEIVQDEQLAQEPPRLRSDHDAIHRRCRLQPRGQVHDLARDDGLAHPAVLDHLAEERGAAGDRDPYGHEPAARRCDLPDAAGDRQCSADSTFRGVLVGARVAEEGEDGIAHEAVEEAVEAADRARDAVLELADDPGHLLGIETPRQLGRADQVAQQHRDLAPFLLPGMRGRGRLAQRRREPALGDGAQQLAAVPQGEADLLQVILGQQPQGLDVNVGRLERLRVAAQSERTQCCRQFVHCALAAGSYQLP